MRVIGYVRSDDPAGERRRVEAGATFRDDALAEILVEDVDGLRQRVAAGDVAAVLVSDLDRLPAGWLDDDDLIALFERHGVAIVAGAERIDTSTAGGRVAFQAARAGRAEGSV